MTLAPVPALPALSVQPEATEIDSGPSVRPAVDANVNRQTFVPVIRDAALEVSVVDDCVTVTSVEATLSTLRPATGTKVTSTWKVAAASSAAPSAVPAAGSSIVAAGVATVRAAVKPVPRLPALSAQPPASASVAAPGATAENAPLAKRKR